MKYMKLGSKPDCFRTDGKNVRYVANELETDIVVKVGEVKFYLHKFPIVSKSALLQKLVGAEGSSDELELHDIPGGPAAFEVCAKFCYGMVVALNAHNVVGARCAAEYLEMHETMDKGNLIYKIEVFLDTSIFRSWKDSIIVLQSTKLLLSPLLEQLKIISRCIESIARKASIDTSKVDWSYTYRRKLEEEEENRKCTMTVPGDWWVEDLCDLEIDVYKQVMERITCNVSSRVIGQSLKAYASRKIPSHYIATTDLEAIRETIGMVLALLPPEKGSVSCRFFLKLLRTSLVVGLSESVRDDLIKRTGRQLCEASLSDLMVDGAVTFNVDVMQKMVREFHLQERNADETESENGSCSSSGRGILSDASKLVVAKLVDGYLAEIAKDPCLDIQSFIDLMGTVSAFPRTSHDGLYRAIDEYLREHPEMSKADRKKMCRLMDCKKLSAEACMHAVQNDRLPLRVIVQVLFFEQVRAAASSASSTPELHKAIISEWGGDGLPIADDLKCSSGEEEVIVKAASGKSTTKAPLVMSKLFSRIWSAKHTKATERRSSSSATSSESPDSIGCLPHQEETTIKSTPSTSGRHSVS